MKTFVLGIGAQKAGTSWLHKQLTSQPYSDFGFTKEYHVFDHAMIDYNDTEILTSEQTAIITNFRENNTEYFDYFQNILSQDDINLTGDITPSYTCLSADTFSHIKQEFNKRNITVKPILIMRDPVYRLHSMAYMDRGPFRNKTDMLSAMHQLHLGRQDSHRSCYDKAMDNASKVFGKENIFYTLYEDLFDHNTIDNLSKFLDLEFINTFNLSDKINAAISKFPITEDEYVYFKSRYMKIYDYCKNELGLPIDERWTFNEGLA